MMQQHTDDKISIKRAILSLESKKVGARIICTDLFLEDGKVIFLAGFGPSQEVRAFAQLLSGRASLAVSTMEGEVIERVYNCSTENQVYLAKGPDNYTLLYSLPRHTGYLIGGSEAGCRDLFYRLLEQEEFVLRPWFPALFHELARLEPTVGSKVCYRNWLKVASRVTQGIRAGEFTFPEPTAHLTVEQQSDPATGRARAA